MSPTCQPCMHSPSHVKRRDEEAFGQAVSWLHGVTRPMGWRATQGCEGRRYITLQNITQAGMTGLWDFLRSVPAMPCSLNPGTPLMLWRPSCSPGLVCFGDEAVGWRRLQFHCQSRGWWSRSVVLSLPRLIPAPMREGGVEKGSSVCSYCPSLVHLQPSVGHGQTPMCFLRVSQHGQHAQPGAMRKEDSDRGSAAPWRALSVSLFPSCEA